MVWSSYGAFAVAAAGAALVGYHPLAESCPFEECVEEHQVNMTLTGNYHSSFHLRQVGVCIIHMFSNPDKSSDTTFKPVLTIYGYCQKLATLA